MTFAPQSANCRAQVGPARSRVRSRTVRCSSGSFAIVRFPFRIVSEMIGADARRRLHALKEPAAHAELTAMTSLAELPLPAGIRSRFVHNINGLTMHLFD